MTSTAQSALQQLKAASTSSIAPEGATKEKEEKTKDEETDTTHVESCLAQLVEFSKKWHRNPPTTNPTGATAKTKEVLTKLQPFADAINQPVKALVTAYKNARARNGVCYCYRPLSESGDRLTYFRGACPACTQSALLDGVSRFLELPNVQVEAVAAANHKLGIGAKKSVRCLSVPHAVIRFSFG
jgi:hypothetical protein